ncbi:dihydrodipicolinate synthase family protein [Paracoccus yeei]|uniref:dihydrodipicolinate synthase family protein n=1 Tax=Paracoccus yeei TaxID=147645 RepID=UPI003BF885F3
MPIFSGLSAFPITPASPAGEVDATSMRKLLSRLVAAGVDSIGVLGSTGSYAYLSREQRRRALEVAVDEVAGRIPLIAGVGALRTDEAVKLARDAKAIGAKAGLLSAMSYLPLSQNEVFAHFTAVADQSGLPLVIYDNPGTTHFSFSTELIVRLSRHPGIVAVKYPTSSRDAIPPHLRDQRTAVGESFSLGYSGDWCCAEAMIAGADTWYSVLGGTLPVPCLQIVRAAQAGDTEEARRLDAALQPVWDLFRKYTSFRTIHEMARQLGLSKADPQRPVQPVCDAGREDVRRILAALPPAFVG